MFPPPEHPAAGNRAKYETRHPLARGAIRRFFDQVGRLVSDARPGSVLDAGCGEGEGIARLLPVLPDRVAGFDIDPDSVGRAAQRFPNLDFRIDDVCRTSHNDGDFDLVLALEVLEHLPEPRQGLRELCRVARHELIVSVPHEPWFRVCNFVGGAFVSTWGNPPDHCQHWDRDSFVRFLEQETTIIESSQSFPWLIARCAPGNGSAS